MREEEEEEEELTCVERCRDRCSWKGCSSYLSKAFLVTINFVFLVLGWSILGFGVWLRLNRDVIFYTHILGYHSASFDDAAEGTHPSYDVENGAAAAAAAAEDGDRSLTKMDFDSLAFILIGIGGILALMSFLGCCGACAESVCFLAFYIVITSLIVIAEITFASISSSLIDKVSTKLRLNMWHQAHFEYNATLRVEHAKLTVAWDTLQMQLKCCGATGPQDYMYSSWYNRTKDSAGIFVPTSCCRMLYDNRRKPIVNDEILCQAQAILSGKTNQPITQAHIQGCFGAIQTLFKDHQNLAVIVLIVTIVLQAMNFFCAGFLIVRIRQKESDYSCYDNDDYE